MPALVPEFGDVFDVGGRRVVLIEDTVASDAPNIDDALQLDPGCDQWGPIWYSESRVIEARERHGNIPVYGLWQVLLYSGMIDASVDGLRCLPLKRPKWAYLYVANGQAQVSGRALTSAVPAMPSLRRENALNIDLDEDILRRCRLPTRQAILPQEIELRERRSKRFRTAVTAGMIAAIAAVSLTIDLLDRARHEALLDEEEKLSSQLTNLEDELARIATQSNPISQADKDAQYVVLRRLAELTRFTTGLRTERGVELYGEEVATLLADGVRPGLSYPWSLGFRIDGVYTLDIPLTDEADAKIMEDLDTRMIEQLAGKGDSK